MSSQWRQVFGDTPISYHDYCEGSLACHLDYAIDDDAFDMSYVCWVVWTNLAMLKKDYMECLDSIDVV